MRVILFVLRVASIKTRRFRVLAGELVGVSRSFLDSTLRLKRNFYGKALCATISAIQMRNGFSFSVGVSDEDDTDFEKGILILERQPFNMSRTGKTQFYVQWPCKRSKLAPRSNYKAPHARRQGCLLVLFAPDSCCSATPANCRFERRLSSLVHNSTPRYQYRKYRSRASWTIQFNPSFKF
jgi:hypothetical protein